MKCVGFIGKDVSALFTEVLNCIQTNNLELKKLVYLYIMNYAKTQPDRAILAVNTFQNVRQSSFSAKSFEIASLKHQI